MIKKHLFTLRTLLCVAWIATSWPSSSAYAQESTADFMQLSLQDLMDADVQAVNVLGTHTHLAGEWMLGYRYMSMHMEGNRDGTKDIGVNRVLQDFRVSPTDMTMEMHMAEVMYAPTDNLTLMAMFPYLRVSMDHITRMGTRFTTEAEGLGDISVRALYTLLGDVRKDRHRLLFSAGLSFPTGGIDEKDGTPAGPDQKLPYPMQLGSGTFDLLPGLVYLGEAQNWSWGSELIPTIRLGENSNDYTLGNRYQLGAWISRKWTDWLSTSVRIDGHIWDNIDGADPDLNPAIVPTADPDRRGGERIDLSLGLNLYVPRGFFKGIRLGLEYGFPLYESLDGPQLETDWHVAVGGSLTWTF